jgi:hypothetical protein
MVPERSVRPLGERLSGENEWNGARRSHISDGVSDGVTTFKGPRRLHAECIVEIVLVGWMPQSQPTGLFSISFGI